MPLCPFSPTPASLPCYNASHEIQEHEKAESDEASHDYPISPLLRRYPPYQTVQSGNLTGSTSDSPVDARQGLSLEPKALIDRIRLTEYAICHVVAVVYPASFAKHILCFRRLWIICMVCVDVAPHICQEVCPVPRFLDLGL